MASCPKCGKPKIKRKKGLVNCKRCGPSGQPVYNEGNKNG